VAELSTESDHRIEFHQTESLAKKTGYMDRLVAEPTEIKLHPDIINREEGFKLSKALNPSTGLIRRSNTYITKIPRKHREERAKTKTE
jgi:hypothetical protein